MDRAERTGLAVAVAGHVVLGGLLSASFLNAKPAEPMKAQPIEVALVDDVALTSSAPDPSPEAPAPALSPVEAPAEPESPPPAPESPPEPAAKPEPPKPAPPKPAPPKPAPAPAAKPEPAPPKPSPPAPAAKPTRPAPPAKSAAARPTKPSTATAPSRPTNRPAAPTGRLDGLLSGIGSKPSPSTSSKPPAAVAGPAVKSALIAELSRKLRPFWRSPTGADVDKLRTEVRVELDQSGKVVRIGDCRQKGEVTPSNRPQVDLHCENAKRAIRLAAPFNTFPAEYYSVWKVIFPVFDRNLK